MTLCLLLELRALLFMDHEDLHPLREGIIETVQL